MSDFATLTDVILLSGKEFTSEESERVMALLPLVSDALRCEAKRVGKDLGMDGLHPGPKRETLS